LLTDLIPSREAWDRIFSTSDSRVTDFRYFGCGGRELSLAKDVHNHFHCFRLCCVVDARDLCCCGCVGHAVLHLRGRMIKEVLVKWKNTSPEDATWEPATILQQFPQLQP